MNNSFLSQKSSSKVVALETNSKQTELNRRYFIVGERRLSNYWWASVIFLGGFGFLLTGISSYLNYNILANAFKLFNVTMLMQALSDGEAIKANLTSNLTPLNENSVIAFFPQGLLMCFYGSLGVLLSIYWWLLIFWDVGGGFNEFNKKEGFMRIFRWGYPGKNRRIDISYPLQDIEAIRVEFKQAQGLLASEQTIFVRLLSTPNNNVVTEQSNKMGREGKRKEEGSSKNGKELKEKREIPLGGIGQLLTLKEIEKQASELANFLQVELEGL
uniref:Photosystem I assembly protein Ycf4 n=1 Tax=Chlamydomonas nivalis TaxID=47906 RepID=A0A0S2IBI2_9CHLO|nr:hypothetical chloroplast RF4 [Chlamydomonas nivalis]